MCGRFALIPSKTSWFTRFRFDYPNNIKPMFNITPGMNVPVVKKDSVNQMKWGLIPSWAIEPNIGYKMINARAETLKEKSAYKKLIARNRCLVPISGFYEWKQKKKKKQPYYIRLKNQEILALAGLFDIWKNPEGNLIESFTIITTEPNALLAGIHNRMPAIIRKENDELWFNEKIMEYESLKSLLRPFDSDDLEAYPVSKMVNSPKNDTPELIDKITAENRF